MQRSLILFICLLAAIVSNAQSEKVNVFLGSSGDHGQMSPGASYPFSLMDICAQTYPNGHTGYEHKAKKILGFTHNRFEGVGCSGSGGNILITPFISNDRELIKSSEKASPGFYSIGCTNGVTAKFTVYQKSGIEQFHFPKNQNGFIIDLSHTLANSFVNESHEFNGSSVSGWIESGTTCDAGIYRIYYYLSFDQPMNITDTASHFIKTTTDKKDITLRIAFSSVSTDYAKASILKEDFETARKKSEADWNRELNRITVTGDPAEEKLFYSEFYRTQQSPFAISEPDGTFRATNGTAQKSTSTVYNGWSIWDNYKTQLPLLSLTDPDRYANIITSLTNLYKSGKQDWATHTEPSNTVRTEHAIVVLLDAYRKGYPVDFYSIRDSLLRETNALSFEHPDKALESSYDVWAMSQILEILHEDSLAAVYKHKASHWRIYWDKDFKDFSKPDADDLPARGMYQGTIWQYRWFVPFDVKGLIDGCGGETNYINQLDTFFENDLYNASNEPDIQVPYMFSGTSMPWKSQNIIHKYVRDTVIQYYYNDNSRGIDPFIDRVFNNRPDAYIRTMDDDGGAMSGWYVLAAIGLSPACPGWPVWYLHVPLFKSVILHRSKKTFTIRVINFSNRNKYIKSTTLNGKPLDRNWLTQSEISGGGELIITASDIPNKSFEVKNRWISSLSQEK
jgi:putative alpha-1,2-mannosidase